MKWTFCLAGEIHSVAEILGKESSAFWLDRESAGTKAIRTRTLLRRAGRKR